MKKNEIVQRTAEMSGTDRRVNATVHASGTHSLTFDLHPGNSYASVYLAFTRADFKAMANLLLGILAETESFAEEPKPEAAGEL